MFSSISLPFKTAPLVSKGVAGTHEGSCSLTSSGTFSEALKIYSHPALPHTFVTMVLGYSISHGIGIGIIAYILVKLCTGKVKEISIATWVIGVLFLATFILT